MKINFKLQKREQITLLIVATALISFWYYNALMNYPTEIIDLRLTYGQNHDARKVLISERNPVRFKKVIIKMEVTSNNNMDQDKIQFHITGITDSRTRSVIKPYFLFDTETRIKNDATALESFEQKIRSDDLRDTIRMNVIGSECFSAQKEVLRDLFIKNKATDKTSTIRVVLNPSEAVIDTLEWCLTCHFPDHFFLTNVSPGPQEKDQCTSFTLKRLDTTRLHKDARSFIISLQTTDNLTKGRHQVWTFLISVVIAACTSILISFYINPPRKPRPAKRKRMSRAKPQPLDSGQPK